MSFCESQDHKTRSVLNTFEFDKLTDKEFNSFVFRWVSNLTGLPEEDLRRVEEEDLKLIWKATRFVLTVPKIEELPQEIKEVKIIGSKKTGSRGEIVGAKINYKQWMLLNQLSSMNADLLGVKHLEIMLRMLLISYPVKFESGEQADRRLKSYESLNLKELYSGLKFFSSVSEWVFKMYPILKEDPQPAGTKAAPQKQESEVIKRFRQLKSWEIFGFEVAKTGAFGFEIEKVYNTPLMEVMKVIEINMYNKLIRI